MSWRVVYGETIPAWEQVFDSKRKAEAFARKQASMGDVIFSVAQTKPGEPPQSLTALIAREEKIAAAGRKAGGA